MGHRGRPDGSWALRWLAIIPALCSFALAGCGGNSSSSSGASCGTINACGGDLTGVWQVTGICIKVTGNVVVGGDAGTGFPPECESAITQAVNTARVTSTNATMEFQSGGQYVQTGTADIKENIDFSASCLRAMGASASDTASVCKILDDSFAQASGTSGSCTAANGGCNCAISTEMPFDGTGTYVAQGNQVAMDGDAAEPYCVQGNTAAIYANISGASGRLDLKR